MPKYPKAPATTSRGSSCSHWNARRQHSRLDEALAALARGVKLDELPDHLLFALAPHVDISRFIHAWVARYQRSGVEPEAPQ